MTPTIPYDPGVHLEVHVVFEESKDTTPCNSNIRVDTDPHTIVAIATMNVNDTMIRTRTLC